MTTFLKVAFRFGTDFNKLLFTKKMSANAGYDLIVERIKLTADKLQQLTKYENTLVETKKQNALKEEESRAETENKRLQEHVNMLKQKLMEAEKANGVVQVALPNQTPDAQTTPVENVTTTKETPAAATPPTANKDAKAEKKKKNANAAKGKATKKPEENEPSKVDVSRLDLRVGQIVNVKVHPDADSLYLEEMDVGEEAYRSVVTGVVKHIPIEQMRNRKVVLLCNLKPAKIRGTLSQAMVMCASTPEKVEIIDPPADACPGERVFVPGFEGVPDSQLNPKKKIFEKVQPDLRINESCVACYQGIPFTVKDKGICKSQTMSSCGIK